MTVLKPFHLSALCALGIFTATVAHATITQVSPAIETAPSVNFLNVEAPFRCTVKEVGDVEVSSTISLSSDDFQLKFYDDMDKLPRFEVNGFTFGSMPVDEVVQQLVEDAEIEVYAEDTAYPELTGKNIYGELTDVMNELTKAGDVFYRYDASRKRIYLSHKGRFELKLPDNRLVMFAVLDALRGADIANIVPNWKNNTILMILTHAEAEKIRDLISYILKESKILVADVRAFRLTPLKTDPQWQRVVNDFGAGRVYTTQNGLVGKLLSMGHQKHSQHLISSLSQDYAITQFSEGVAVVPNNWKMRFDIGRCTTDPTETVSVSVLLNANVKSPDTVETTLTLDSARGEITSFDVISAIDEELAVVGVPVFEREKQGEEELLFTVKLRFIRLVKGGE